MYLKKRVSIYLVLVLSMMTSACSTYYYGLGFSPMDFYFSFYGWIDFFLFFIIFASAVRITLEKHLGEESGAGKALYLSIGALAALTLTLFEMSRGSSLIDFGPSTLILLLMFVLIILSKFFKGEDDKMPLWLKILLGILFLAFILSFFGMNLFDWNFPLLGNVWPLLITLAILWGLYWLFSKWKTKEGEGGEQHPGREARPSGERPARPGAQPGEGRAVGKLKVAINLKRSPREAMTRALEMSDRTVFGTWKYIVGDVITAEAIVKKGSGNYKYKWNIQEIGTFEDKRVQNFPTGGLRITKKLETFVKLLVTDTQTGAQGFIQERILIYPTERIPEEETRRPGEERERPETPPAYRATITSPTEGRTRDNPIIIKKGNKLKVKGKSKT